MLQNLGIKQKLLWGVFLVSLISITVGSFLSYNTKKQEILSGIDDNLMTAAYGVSYVFPPKFYAGIEHQNSISDEEHLKNVKMLTEFAQRTGLRYVYSYMMFGDTIRYVLGSDDPKDIQNGTYDRFFIPYDSPPDSLLRSFADRKMRTAEYTDQYGRFRSVFIPLEATNGKVFVVGADVSMSSLEQKLRDTAVLSVSFNALIFLVLFLGIYVIISRTVKPLSELTGYTRVLVEQNFNWGDSIRRKVKSICEAKRDEVGRLAEALGQMESTLQIYVDYLTETTAAKERIESELSIARNIQMGFLPQTFPAFPDHKEFDLHAIIEPAKEVGGDLYDYFMLDDRHLFFLIGDVSDKGVPAALFMAVTKTLFGIQASQADRAISEVMQKVNKELSGENPWQMFVTAFACVLDVETGEVQYCDAGHEPPFILRLGKEVEVVKKKSGVALCFFDDSVYDSGTMQLRPGDALVLYTDGVTEAMNKDRKMFRREGITQALQPYCSAATPAATITQALLEHVRRFAGDTPQSDDITILVVSHCGTDARTA
jgi:sigma-B regulation protein RsbU (phosphoserine phosphatase)